jgi:protein-tyrosine phosphatase
MEFAPDSGSLEVPDPYYGGPAGFERVLDLAEAASRGLLRAIRCGVVTGLG